jgi:hypothetical protein
MMFNEERKRSNEDFQLEEAKAYHFTRARPRQVISRLVAMHGEKETHIFRDDAPPDGRRSYSQCSKYAIYNYLLSTVGPPK